ncbi:MAG: DUF951 domain-containing protein [Clostridia bacterium]|nr:DUF951 domain-containing protein [Clostridia bacterium]
MKISVGDKIETKKQHPCGSSIWTVVRVGADVKIKCEGCGRVVMLTVPEFEKRLKKIIGE